MNKLETNKKSIGMIDIVKVEEKAEKSKKLKIYKVTGNIIDKNGEKHEVIKDVAVDRDGSFQDIAASYIAMTLFQVGTHGTIDVLIPDYLTPRLLNDRSGTGRHFSYLYGKAYSLFVEIRGHQKTHSLENTNETYTEMRALQQEIEELKNKIESLEGER